MDWKLFRNSTMLLICSALITIAYSFPTATEHNPTTSLPQNKTAVLNTKEEKPLVVIVEAKDPKSESVIVQFVYKSNGGNSITDSKGKDKDKYVIDYPVHKEKPNQKLNISEKEKAKQLLNTNKKQEGKNNEPKQHSAKDIQMMTATPLMAEEISPISGKWPKYFYDVFNPIQPFPELQYGKPNQINIDKEQSENAEAYSPYNEKDKKVPLNVAGPQLHPLSIYDREFNVPIFG